MHWPTALRALSRSALGVMMLVGALAAQNAGGGASRSVVPPNHERLAGSRALEQGWQYDALGNGWITRGSGAPVRLIACSAYHTGYVVSQITADGYLRLQVSGSASRHRCGTSSTRGSASAWPRGAARSPE